MRRGATLIEMPAMLLVAALIVGGALDGLGRLQRLAAVDPGMGIRLDRACLALRRDLAAGQAAFADGTVTIQRTGGGPVVWRMVDGQLERDGVLQSACAGLAWRGTAIVITAAGLPERVIEVGP